MTVPTTVNRTVYLGAGIVGPFATGFPFIQNADVKAIKTLIATGIATALVEGPDYTLVQDPATFQGTLNLTVAIDNTYKLTIYRDPAATQNTSWPPNDKFPAKTTEQAVDRLTMLVQRFTDLFSRGARLSDSDVSGADPTLPTPVAGSVLGWDATALKLQNYIQAGVFAITAYGQTLINAANAAAARAVLLSTAVGDALFTAATAAAARTTILIDGQSRVIKAGDLASSAQGWSMVNGTLAATQNGTVLTVAVKTLAGADPSAADPVYVLFRNATAKTGDFTVIALTAATSIATVVGGTFGVANATAFKLWVVGFNDGGVFRLGLINCLSGNNIYPLGQVPLASSTQIGAGSVLAQTFYTAGAAVAAKAYAILGTLNYEAGLAAAGTFGIDQSKLQLFGPNTPLPGAIVQQVVATDTTERSTTGTTFVTSNLAPSITPTSAANLIELEASTTGDAITAGNNPAANSEFQITRGTATGTSLSLHRIVVTGNGSLATTWEAAAGVHIKTYDTNQPGATTYTLAFRAVNAGDSARVQKSGTNGIMTVKEIVA